MDGTDKKHLPIDAFKDLFEFSRDVLWTIDIHGVITYVSPAITTLRGIDQQTARTQTLDQIHPPASAAKSSKYFLYMIEEIQAGRRPKPFNDELEYFHINGSILTTEVYAVPIFDRKGDFIFLAGVSRDISHRMLQDAKEKAMQKARDIEFKSMLNQVLEHEMRNALSVIEMALADNASLKKLSLARHATKNMIEILDQIRIYATQEKNQERLRLKKVSLASITNQISQVADVQARIVLDDQLTRRVWVEQSLVEMCILQLLSNSKKYSPESSIISIQIDTLTRNSSEGVVVRITNKHASPEPIEITRLFEPFYRGRNSDKVAGSGLGLSIALRLSQMMEGDILINHSDEDFTASLWLPIKKPC